MKYGIMTQDSHNLFIGYCARCLGLPSSSWAVFPAPWLPELHCLSQPTVWMVHSWTEVLSAIPVPEFQRDYEMGWRRRSMHQQCLQSYSVCRRDRPKCKYVIALKCVCFDLRLSGITLEHELNSSRWLSLRRLYVKMLCTVMFWYCSV